jgi:hypothetical protein
MSIERIDYDPVTGVETLLEFNESEPGKFHIHHRQDVQPILERNKMLQNDPDYKKQGIKQGMQHIASIPPVWAHHFKKKFGLDVFVPEARPKLHKLLQDPQFQFLRSTLGRI